MLNYVYLFNGIVQCFIGESYTYHWSLRQKPDGDDVGEIKGTDKQELQLSKVRTLFQSAGSVLKAAHLSTLLI